MNFILERRLIDKLSLLNNWKRVYNVDWQPLQSLYENYHMDDLIFRTSNELILRAYKSINALSMYHCIWQYNILSVCYSLKKYNKSNKQTYASQEFVSDLPYCRGEASRRLVVARNNSITLRCEVDAQPEASSYTWVYGDSNRQEKQIIYC